MNAGRFCVKKRATQACLFVFITDFCEMISLSGFGSFFYLLVCLKVSMRFLFVYFSFVVVVYFL